MSSSGAAVGRLGDAKGEPSLARTGGDGVGWRLLEVLGHLDELKCFCFKHLEPFQHVPSNFFGKHVFTIFLKVFGVWEGFREEEGGKKWETCNI